MASDLPYRLSYPFWAVIGGASSAPRPLSRKAQGWAPEPQSWRQGLEDTYLRCVHFGGASLKRALRHIVRVNATLLVLGCVGLPHYHLSNDH